MFSRTDEIHEIQGVCILIRSIHLILGLRTVFFGPVRSSVQKHPLDRTEQTERLRRLVRGYRSSTALVRTTVVQYVVQQFTNSRRGLGMQKRDKGHDTRAFKAIPNS